MSKAYLPVLIGLVLVALVGALVYSQNQPSQPTPTGQVNTTPNAGAESGAQTYTRAEVAQHESASSCWSIIRGEVYDLTAWIANHPGGERAILGLCGEDGTEDFTERHGGQSTQEATLASFKIGVLAN